MRLSINIAAMINDRLAQLMARQLSGEASPQEQGELEELLNEDPQAQTIYGIFCDYWTLEPSPVNDDIQEEIHFQQVLSIAEKDNMDLKAQEDQPPGDLPKIYWIKRAAIAAVFFGLILVSYFLIRSNQENTGKDMTVNEVVARAGARPYLELPDGTKVWLNSESRLEYKGNFNDSLREVTLEGEAFFDVVKDKSRPFIVHTSDIDIRVLGTAFNVKSYPKESQIEATLIHGLIEVTNKRQPSSTKFILHPHEKLIFARETKIPVLPATGPQKNITNHNPISYEILPKHIADSAIVETSWVYNKLIFDGESFREIARKMERWYNVRIRFKSEKIADIPIHVEFKNETIEEALKALQVIEPFNYTIQGNEIEIQSK